MGRPRTFDIDEALDAAIEAFWDRGYEATSMADLMQAMGLQKGSIYKVWDDKRALFLASLRRYLDRAFLAVEEVLASGATPGEGLANLMEFFVGRCAEGKRGCFATNTVVELAPHDSGAADLLADHHRLVLDRIRTAVAKAQASGEWSPDQPPDDVAELLFALVIGMVTRSKGTFATDQARRVAELTVRTLR